MAESTAQGIVCLLPILPSGLQFVQQAVDGLLGYICIAAQYLLRHLPGRLQMSDAAFPIIGGLLQILGGLFQFCHGRSTLGIGNIHLTDGLLQQVRRFLQIGNRLRNIVQNRFGLADHPRDPRRKIVDLPDVLIAPLGKGPAQTAHRILCGAHIV